MHLIYVFPLPFRKQSLPPSQCNKKIKMHLSSFSIKRDKCLTLLFCYSILFCVSHEVGPKSIILLPVFLSEYSILSTFFHINQCNSLASFLIVGCIVFYFMDITIHVTKLCFGKLSYSQTFCS